ncbi:TIGR04283 family arsenosugar biosynthesis glycosyltransferase [Cochleicola gelatinilyticus]|uniref:Glycosyl transferase family 2 n=1 Tax=Cochleicola gelatinilyticus TaxID=1763537 RepID=A0A167IMV0_9FLAO|nr:TIGR04283 family arsenosugar biosynthesis glycosyltransferase [Cochleicola gelatinilyticus]OAB79834.1 glycosyl transferase family 2 [Cochleicola gelatinilyticus]
MISIIIPVLNEAVTIESLLLHLCKNASETQIADILVIDGGSTDDTRTIVQRFSRNSTFPIQLIASEKGRAKQMNTGAQHATGTILYFLHADSFPPKGYDSLISEAVQKGNPAGCFKMKFDSDHWWLRLASWLTKFNWRACRGGDQSQFITRALFDEIGGFDETFVIYEDNILINELYSRNKFIVIQEWITSSARLYREKGIWNLQYHFWAIYVKRWLGADAEELYAYYVKHIKLHRKTSATLSEKGVQPKEVFSDK